jgi:hypothetical protein
MTRRGEQPIDELLISIRRAVLYKGLDLFRSRRKADHIKEKTANERMTVSLRRRCQASLLKFGQHEGIDRIPHPRTILDSGSHWASRRTIGPGGLRARPHIGRIFGGPERRTVGAASHPNS